VGRQLKLRLLYSGGVPLDGGGQPIRPIRIAVELVPVNGARVRVSGVPLLAATPAGVQVLEAAEAVSDDAGVVTFALAAGAAWPEDLQVVLDRERMLGPLAELWPELELRITGRPAQPPRWSAMVTERVKGKVVTDGVFATSLNKRIRDRSGAMATLPLDAPARLASVRAGELPRALPVLADTWEGRVDVLLVGTIESEFASTMSANRVWYEARARIVAYDVWTGAQLATIEDTVTAAGVGDERADREARGQLADKLADRLVQVLAAGRASSGS
jgi:hypothetical protein